MRLAVASCRDMSAKAVEDELTEAIAFIEELEAIGAGYGWVPPIMACLASAREELLVVSLWAWYDQNMGEQVDAEYTLSFTSSVLSELVYIYNSYEEWTSDESTVFQSIFACLREVEELCGDNSPLEEEVFSMPAIAVCKRTRTRGARGVSYCTTAGRSE